MIEQARAAVRQRVLDAAIYARKEVEQYSNRLADAAEQMMDQLEEALLTAQEIAEGPALPDNHDKKLTARVAREAADGYFQDICSTSSVLEEAIREAGYTEQQTRVELAVARQLEAKRKKIFMDRIIKIENAWKEIRVSEKKAKEAEELKEVEEVALARKAVLAGVRGERRSPEAAGSGKAFRLRPLELPEFTGARKDYARWKEAIQSILDGVPMSDAQRLRPLRRRWPAGRRRPCWTPPRASAWTTRRPGRPWTPSTGIPGSWS